MKVRVYIEEAGCDRRRLDAQTIRDYVRANRHEIVLDPRDADRIVCVTCAFKEKEEDESVKRLRSLGAYGRDILVYGCLKDIASERYAEFGDLPSIAPREIDTIDRFFEGHSLPFADVPTANISSPERSVLVQARRHIEARLVPAWRQALSQFAEALSPPRAGASRHTAETPFNLFVCRGCTGLCSYCAIRRSIGPAKSKPVQEVRAEFMKGLDQGYRTFNILGDDPGCYGLDLSATLPDLLGTLLETAASREALSREQAETTPMPIRLQLREVHPKYLVRYQQEILDLTHPQPLSVLCPIQSGSDRVLELMQREHCASELLDALSRLRVAYPTMQLDTQIIVGFPTETRADFERTLDFVRDAQFDSVVVFPYHQKEGTAASRLDGAVSRAEIDRRMRAAFRYFRDRGIRAYRSCQ
jgi:tRNA A37 methylthiotransferase MiaB